MRDINLDYSLNIDIVIVNCMKSSILENSLIHRTSIYLSTTLHNIMADPKFANLPGIVSECNNHDRLTKLSMEKVKIILVPGDLFGGVEMSLDTDPCLQLHPISDRFFVVLLDPN